MPLPLQPVMNLPGRVKWCFHLGPVLDYRGGACHFAYLFKCHLHGSCTLQHKPELPGVPNCRECPDYEPES